MAKVHKPTNQKVRASRARRAKPDAKPAGLVSSSRRHEITSDRYPKMSASALAFARQMLANPHVRAVMRDLADK